MWFTNSPNKSNNQFNIDMEIKIINTRMCTNYFCHLAIAEYGTLDPLTSWKDGYYYAKMHSWTVILCAFYFLLVFIFGRLAAVFYKQTSAGWCYVQFYAVVNTHFFPLDLLSSLICLTIEIGMVTCLSRFYVDGFLEKLLNIRVNLQGNLLQYQ